MRKEDKWRKKEDSETDSIWSEDSEYVIVAFDPEGEDSEGFSGKCSLKWLFVEIIGINRCEEDVRTIYN